MKTVTKTFNVYEFKELSEKIQNKVINTQIEFILSWPFEDMSEGMKKACLKAESIQTPWFVGE